MDHQPLSKDTTEQPKQHTRKKAADALVRCEGFRCLAYLGKDGLWHCAADDSPLKVLEVLLRF